MEERVEPQEIVLGAGDLESLDDDIDTIRVPNEFAILGDPMQLMFGGGRFRECSLRDLRQDEGWMDWNVDTLENIKKSPRVDESDFRVSMFQALEEIFDMSSPLNDGGGYPL